MEQAGEAGLDFGKLEVGEVGPSGVGTQSWRKENVDHKTERRFFWRGEDEVRDVCGDEEDGAGASAPPHAIDLDPAPALETDDQLVMIVDVHRQEALRHFAVDAQAEDLNAHHLKVEVACEKWSVVLHREVLEEMMS